MSEPVFACAEVVTEIRGRVGFITLNRPRAVNALSLPMVRALLACLLAWREDARVQAVAIRGMGKQGPFGAFCAGGDIRFFHQAMLRGDAELEDFFTEEYALNHLIHHYPKPYIAFMDGIVMGGGMGVSQGARLRIVTERTRMAMPETNIGLFPDVGGGWFLGRCPSHGGEWLALTSEVIGAGDAMALTLADACFASERITEAWDALAGLAHFDAAELQAWQDLYSVSAPASTLPLDTLARCFNQPDVLHIVQALEQDDSEWAAGTAKALRTHSPLMLQVTLEQIRRGVGMSLADELRMERDMVRHCFNKRHLDRFMTATDTMEGIRALVVDKDRAPKWNPARLEDVTPEMVAGFFVSPWPVFAHPLR
ncbi:MAG: enoyl-CoA hydratase/isomerase family protein, partial [Gammaproteobacteria bacterium]|nr:enoyl-CoA hydratase/isomerase family protein [Gammaproteobacteria bacterium]